MPGFLQMGGYGAYVWSAFGFAALVLASLLVISLRGARARDVELDRLRAAVRGETAPAPRRPVLRDTVRK